MSTQTKAESKSQKNNGASPSIVWFEIPADNVERARTFYGKLFGWKIDKFPGPTTKPYWLIDTGAGDAKSGQARLAGCVLLHSVRHLCNHLMIR